MSNSFSATRKRYPKYNDPFALSAPMRPPGGALHDGAHAVALGRHDAESVRVGHERPAEIPIDADNSLRSASYGK